MSVEELSPQLSTNAQSDVWEGPTDTPEYTAWLKAHLPKSPPVPGAGRKCYYCENKEKVQRVVDDYLEKHQTFGEKASIPFIEELAMILKRNASRINDWVIKKDEEGKPEHPDLINSIDRLKNIQKLRLLQRTLGRYNPTGAIFQLKANHGLIETEKKVLTGDSREPLLIELIEAKQLPEEND